MNINLHPIYNPVDDFDRGRDWPETWLKRKKMLTLPRIIAPVDFSEPSRRGAIFAARLACHFHSELTLLHVLDPCGHELTPSEIQRMALAR